MLFLISHVTLCDIVIKGQMTFSVGEPLILTRHFSKFDASRFYGRGDTTNFFVTWHYATTCDVVSGSPCLILSHHSPDGGCRSCRSRDKMFLICYKIKEGNNIWEVCPTISLNNLKIVRTLEWPILMSLDNTWIIFE